MHSKIFQITTVKVTNEGRLTENTLTQGDGSFYDYCMEIEPDIRKQCIDILVNKILPSGMFELTGEDTSSIKVVPSSGRKSLWPTSKQRPAN